MYLDGCSVADNVITVQEVTNKENAKFVPWGSISYHIPGGKVCVCVTACLVDLHPAAGHV